jgi:hypothetical protein
VLLRALSAAGYWQLLIRVANLCKVINYFTSIPSGAIKRETRDGSSGQVMVFQFLLVRLKARLAYFGMLNFVKFQFLLVRLRGLYIDFQYVNDRRSCQLLAQW